MYGEEYKKAMEKIPFSSDFQQKTVEAMMARRPKRKRGLLFSAAAAAVAAAVILGLFLWPVQDAGSPVPDPAGPVVGGPLIGHGGPGISTQALSAYALSEPVYPDFPQFPEGEALYGDSDEYLAYRDKINEIRLGARNDRAGWILTGFAEKSTPLVLEGHQGENVVYSPVSLWMALSMLARCAEGESREQVLAALGTEDLDALTEDVEHLWRQLYTDDGVSTLRIANSVWLDQGMRGTFVQDTLDTLARDFYAGSYTVPMGTKEATKAISDWVSAQTGGLIKPGVDTKDILALLVSSLYYRAGWDTEFSPSRTEPDTFTCANGQENTVDFMHKTEDMGRFLRRDGYLAAALSTKLGEMIFVLPDEGVTPEELLAREGFLTRLDISRNNPDAILGEVEWSVPKFDVDSKLKLASTLGAMGITDLLSPDRADLSALTSAEAYLQGVDQLGRVKVDEEGVEAAAVTIIYTVPSSAPVITETAVMDLDRPFLFLIRQEGVPLFVGVVNEVK